MNQDERRAKLAIDNGEARQALERAGFTHGTVEVLMEWLKQGLYQYTGKEVY